MLSSSGLSNTPAAEGGPDGASGHHVWVSHHSDGKPDAPGRQQQPNQAAPVGRIWCPPSLAPLNTKVVFVVNAI